MLKPSWQHSASSSKPRLAQQLNSTRTAFNSNGLDAFSAFFNQRTDHNERRLTQMHTRQPSKPRPPQRTVETQPVSTDSIPLGGPHVTVGAFLPLSPAHGLPRVRKRLSEPANAITAIVAQSQANPSELAQQVELKQAEQKERDTRVLNWLRARD